MKKYSLSVKERIKNKKDFDRIYSLGKALISYDKTLRAIYLYDSNEKLQGVKIAAAVSKKAGNAVWRNKVKRLIKESFRQNKESLVALSKKHKILLLIIFSANLINEKRNKEIDYQEILPQVLDLINKIERDVKPVHIG